MNIALIMLASLSAYFALLLFISRRAKGAGEGNGAFFRASRNSAWPLVAFGMIGASISGVTFISVPGWAEGTGMTYLQMCMGFIAGYVVVAFVLLPVYYRLRLTSIYDYLGRRLGKASHRTSALFFILSKLTGAAARFYLVCLIITRFVTAPYLGDGPGAFALTTAVILLLIWLYTRRSGMQTIVRTDALQTACLILAAVWIFIVAARRMNLDMAGVYTTITQSPMCRIFEWDWSSKQAFWRQFLSGIFIVIVMTGLDQDMMQKNLTCRSLKEAQQDMCCYGVAFLPVNALFLCLGILLYTYCAQAGLQAPGGDSLLPWMVAGNHLGTWVIIPFTIGITAAAFSSADSAMTALTTTVCVDLLGMKEGTEDTPRSLHIRQYVHGGIVLSFAGFILLFRLVGNDNILNAIYVLASYTYGPLLGLYAFALCTGRQTRERAVPYICIASPVVCGLLDYYAPRCLGYTFGYELLMLNGLLVFAALWLSSRTRRHCFADSEPAGR